MSTDLELWAVVAIDQSTGRAAVVHRTTMTDLAAEGDGPESRPVATGFASHVPDLAATARFYERATGRPAHVQRFVLAPLNGQRLRLDQLDLELRQEEREDALCAPGPDAAPAPTPAQVLAAIAVLRDGWDTNEVVQEDVFQAVLDAAERQVNAALDREYSEELEDYEAQLLEQEICGATTDTARSIMGQLGEQAMALAQKIMQLTQEQTTDRIVAGAALLRAQAGYWARFAVDNGDPPEAAEEAVIIVDQYVAGLAAELVRKHGRTSSG